MEDKQYEDKISILQNTIQQLRLKIDSLEIQLKNKTRDYELLLKRYIRQNDELTLLMLEHPIERKGRTNDNKRGGNTTKIETE